MDSALLLPRRRRGIGLTALIDVVFILLLFFMLTSTFTQWKAVDFKSPVASDDADADDPQLVILGGDGSLTLRGSAFSVGSYQELSPQYLTAFDNNRPVVVLPEADSHVQDIVATIERLQSIGLNAVTLGKAIPADNSSD